MIKALHATLLLEASYLYEKALGSTSGLLYCIIFGSIYCKCIFFRYSSALGDWYCLISILVPILLICILFSSSACLC